MPLMTDATYSREGHSLQIHSVDIVHLWTSPVDSQNSRDPV